MSIPSFAPNSRFVFDESSQPVCVCSACLESPGIPLLPKRPANKQDIGVKASTEEFGNGFPGVDPPLQRRTLPRLGIQVKVHPPQVDMPNFLAETTAQKDVVQRFRPLITQDAGIRILQAMTEVTGTSPAPVMNSQPEEAHSRWGSCLPNLFGPKDRSRA